MGSERFERAIAAIDAANADDPHTIAVDGAERPKEIAHAELVTAWVRRIQPEPSETLLLAARAHHLRRWITPRSSYPDGRGGYLTWRRDAGKRQADEVHRILADAGYDEATIQRVRAIVRKQNLAGDAEVQVLEDAMCLVFLETQFDELATRMGRERTVEILRKTIGKMSPVGLGLVATIPLSEKGQQLLGAAASEQ